MAEIPISTLTRMTFQSHVSSATPFVLKAVLNGVCLLSKKMMAVGCVTAGSTLCTSGTTISDNITTWTKLASQWTQRSNSWITLEKSTPTHIWTIQTFQSYFQMKHTGSPGHLWPYLTSWRLLSLETSLTMIQYLWMMLSKSLTLLILGISTPI